MVSERIRQLELSDISQAQGVRDIAGWNQTDGDWERLIRFEPEGCFVVEHEFRFAGTATTTIHSGKVGWIGMVLIRPVFRRRGLATLLLKKCIEYLNPRVKCIKLDATPAGMPVYKKLGFVEESRLHRWEGRGIAREFEVSDTDYFPLALDEVAFGADRSDFLRVLAKSSQVHSHEYGGGYGMIREGINASYLGPVVAHRPELGQELVENMLSLAVDRPVYWDIPDENLPAVKVAKTLGFVKQRELIRMRLGDPGFEGDPTKQWAITGPETG